MQLASFNETTADIQSDFNQRKPCFDFYSSYLSKAIQDYPRYFQDSRYFIYPLSYKNHLWL